MNSINDHRMLMAEWKPTPHTFGWMDPTLIVVHETGTRITRGSAVSYCRAPKRTNPIRVGYHIIIERDGTIVQLARFNQKVRHAGVSSWKGREYANSFSVGIGLVGPTELKGNESRAISFYKRWFTSKDGIKAADSPHHGRGHIWLPYTHDQQVALDEVVAELRGAYSKIEATVGHYHVSPRRKIDPSPLLDFSKVGQLADEQLPIEGHDVAHAADQLGQPQIIAAATSKDDRKAETDKVLTAQSREYRATGFIKVGAGVGAAGTSMYEAFSAASLQGTKAYLDLVNGFVAAYGVPILIAAGVGTWALCELIQHYKRESYDAGLYEPMGQEADGGAT